jgi:hypothetical protein
VNAEGAILLELRALRAEIAGLREDHHHMERRLLERDDRRAGEALLPLLHELVGDAVFSGPSVFAVLLNDRTPVGQAARELISDIGSVKAFGKFLARLDGIALAGVRLVPVGKQRDNRAWQLVQVSDAGNPQ